MNNIREDVVALVKKESAFDIERFGYFNSHHEGYSVLKEEIEEAGEELKRISDNLQLIWCFVKSDKRHLISPVAKTCYNNAVNLACEAIQVAAVCMKLMNRDEREEIT